MVDLNDADDADLAGALNAFRSAVRATHQDIVPKDVQRIVMALDGSNQDDMTLGLAQAVALQTGASLTPVLGNEPSATRESSPYLAQRIEQLESAGIQVQCIEPSSVERRPWELLLHAVEASEAGLLMVDAPYLEDMGVLGHDSVGSNLDLLLARSPVPILVVRAPFDDPAQCLSRVVLPIIVTAGHDPEPAAWAARVVSSTGDLRIVAAVDEDVIRRATWIHDGADFEQLDDESLAGLREPKNAGLIAAIQRYAATQSLGCKVSVRAGELIPTLLDLAGKAPHLFVVRCPRKPTAPAFGQVLALIRSSEHPLLVI